METLKKIKRKVSGFLFPLKETEPEAAYDIWAGQYDAQPDNLMLALDEALFASLMKDVSFTDKIVADVGCGTGRHWNKIYMQQPALFKGYDVSQGMLDVLKQKFPKAETHQLSDNTLKGLNDKNCDVLITTLAIAHIPDIENAFREWNRVLKNGATILLTDYHPDTLSKGGNRTFVHEGKKIAVKNYIHSLDKVRNLFHTLGFREDRFEEKVIDESVRHYYEKQNALPVYERFKNTPMIYGMMLTKTDAAQ
jgi:ubiquinone/menaquinone biosynthesis C-methylase UbiE